MQPLESLSADRRSLLKGAAGGFLRATSPIRPELPLSTPQRDIQQAAPLTEEFIKGEAISPEDFVDAMDEMLRDSFNNPHDFAVEKTLDGEPDDILRNYRAIVPLGQDAQISIYQYHTLYYEQPYVSTDLWFRSNGLSSGISTFFQFSATKYTHGSSFYERLWGGISAPSRIGDYTSTQIKMYYDMLMQIRLATDYDPNLILQVTRSAFEKGPESTGSPQIEKMIQVDKVQELNRILEIKRRNGTLDADLERWAETKDIAEFLKPPTPLMPRSQFLQTVGRFAWNNRALLLPVLQEPRQQALPLPESFSLETDNQEETPLELPSGEATQLSQDSETEEIQSSPVFSQEII